MKHKIFLLTLAVAVLAGCNDSNPPSQGGNTNPGGPGGSGGNGGGTTQNVTMGFTYELIGPFMYSFTNTSKGAESYKWDFGDGTWSNGTDALHQYESAGTYTVTLTGTVGATKYDYRKTITVKNPSIYVAGYTLYKIPYENKYYKVACEDDEWFGTDWGFTTVYTPLLDNSDIPYVKYFNSPLLMDKLDGDNYYTFYVYYTSNSSNTNGDTQCLKQKLQKSEIYTYKNEHILTSDNGKTKIGIIMEYR